VSEYWASRGSAKDAIESFNLYLKHLGIKRFVPKAQERNYGLQVGT